MGAWGYDWNENDGALDLLASMREGDFSFESIGWAFEDEYLEVDGGQYALALVEVVLAALKVREAGKALEGIDLNEARTLFTAERVAWIISTAERTLAGAEGSELYELWEEAGTLGEWRDPAERSVQLLASTYERHELTGPA